jgi:UDP-glucose 4-epimerase
VQARRILITGVASPWAGALARALEADPGVEAVVGVDARDPVVELERTEFVRAGAGLAGLGRIVRAAAIDTVVETQGSPAALAACGGDGSPVRRLVFSSSAHYYGAAGGDPAFFTEAMTRSRRPHTSVEAGVVEAEAAVEAYAAAHPRVTVAVLRFADSLGGDPRAALGGLLALPAVPSILGFDPRCQFLHAEDVTGVLEFAVRRDLEGTYNAAADGVLALSEVASLLGKRVVPVLPPWGTGLVAGPLSRVGLGIGAETVDQLRHGRGLDNRKLKAAGYAFAHTTREAVIDARERAGAKRLTDGAEPPYRYERDIEEFLRRSPSVRSGPPPGPPEPPAAPVPIDPPKPPPAPRRRPAARVVRYDDLDAAAIAASLTGLSERELTALRHHEERRGARRPVLDAIDAQLGARSGA